LVSADEQKEIEQIGLRCGTTGQPFVYGFFLGDVNLFHGRAT
jgi:hypothetical protein